MTIIKKKDVKAFKLNENKKDLEELVNPDGSPIEGDRNAVNDTEIEVPNAQTTDDFAASAIQPRRPYNAYGGTASAWTSKVTENIDDVSSDTKTSFSKPITAGKAQELIDSIKKNNLSGEELGIILSHIISNVNPNSIPQQYKEKLISQINA